MAEFLFEIGLEEVPARMIAGAEAELARRVVAMLERERLATPGMAVKSYSTPRRLAVWVGEVAARQEDVAEEMLGPSAKIAYKEGVPTPAAVAFAKKAGVAVEKLKTVSTPKGEYLQATSVKTGRGAAEVIAAELPKELAGIYWAKNMYWRAGKPERFVRPVRWLLALLGGDVVPVEFAGYTAGRETFGHRVLHRGAPIVVNQPGEYAEVLRAAFVEADVEARRHTIRKALDRVCRALPDKRWREDHALVDKLTHLTEWPTVIAGSFEPEYLALPEEVLVTVMRDHQSYFAVEDKQGKLAPHFLAVLNTQADAAGESVIRHGNERVLRARFNDARFFWQFDHRISLLDRAALLGTITFQKDLGTYEAKSARVRELCRRLSDMAYTRGFQVDFNALLDAAALAKTDLTTELVKEFTELQGMVGGLYARSQGVSEKAADAIYDQYKPVSMDAPIARTHEGQLLAIADKADTISGMFSLGLEPTGSKDPFALRRAANGVVKTLAESDVPLRLTEIARMAESYDGKMVAFLTERLAFYLRETRGHTSDVVQSVLAEGADDVRDAVLRSEAVTTSRGSEDFIAVCVAYKRMKNILAQATEKSLTVGSFLPIFATELEARFWEAINTTGRGFSVDCDTGNYKEALIKLAALRPVVDDYFLSTMVMVDDEDVRAHRLGTLDYLVKTFRRVADFSEIVTPG